MVVKTFRGLLTTDNQDRIRLQTIKGKVGYRVKNFQIMSLAPITDEIETVMKIYLTEQSTIDATVNFSDSDLIVAALTTSRATARTYPINQLMILDNVVFNQDIYITMKEEASSTGCNYILELEVIPLDDAGAEYTTLKDMRQS